MSASEQGKSTMSDGASVELKPAGGAGHRGEATAAAARAVAMTVILPVFNESATLPKTLEAVLADVAVNDHHRYVFVDDGSTDQTLSLLRERLGPEGDPGASGSGRVSFVSYPENRGKGHAIRTGIASLRGSGDEFVVFMDGDMAYDLDHLPVIAASLATHDVVIGSRKESPEERRNTKKLRRLMGWVFNTMVRVGMGLAFMDTQAGLKGFRLNAAREIFPRVRLRGFAFDVEALFIAQRRGYSIAEIPARVSRAHRKKASNVNLALEPLKMAGDLVRIRWNSLLGRYR